MPQAVQVRKARVEGGVTPADLRRSTNPIRWAMEQKALRYPHSHSGFLDIANREGGGGLLRLRQLNTEGPVQLSKKKKKRKKKEDPKNPKVQKNPKL